MNNLAETLATTITLSEIRRDGGTQMRENISDVTVITYAEHMLDGAEFPAITVFYDGAEYWLADGFHRCAAYEKAGYTEVPADIRSGTQKDAVRFALKANATNGRPRTEGDMRRAYHVAVEMGLCADTDTESLSEIIGCTNRWARKLTETAREKEKAKRDVEIIRLKEEGKTQREIAETLGVSQPLVSKVNTDHKRNSSICDQDDLDAAIEAEKKAAQKILEDEKKNRYAKAAQKIQEDDSVIQSRQNDIQHAEINAQHGDVYIIKGKQSHKLFVADSFDYEAIKAQIPQIDCVLTDPPYGINYKSPTGSAMAVRGDYKVIEADDQDFDPSILFKYCDKVITWGANHYANRLDNSAGWLVWDKRDGEQINNNSDCELAWTNMLGSARLFHHRWNGMIKASEHGTKRIHPTQKPIKLFKWCLEITNAGQHIVDMFAGSGSSLIACDETDRNCYLVEKDPVFASAIIKRMQENGFEVVKA